MSKSVLSINEWMTSSVKYMAPKINDKGGKSINNRLNNATTQFTLAI